MSPPGNDLSPKKESIYNSWPVPTKNTTFQMKVTGILVFGVSTTVQGDSGGLGYQTNAQIITLLNRYLRTMPTKV